MLWPSMGAVSLTLGLLHVLVWTRERHLSAYLAFGIASMAVAAMSLFELSLMRVTSVARAEDLIRWSMVTMTVLLAALLLFIRLYFRAGNLRLLAAACVGHALCMIPNFLSGANLIFTHVDRLQPVLGWDGSTIGVPVGTPNPWMLAWYLSDLPMLAFWVSVIQEVRARGERDEVVRRAWLTCGALIAFAIGAATWAILVSYGWQKAPFMVNVPFVVVVLIVGYVLAGDVLSAARLSQDLARNELRLLEKEREQAMLREELAHLSRVAALSELSGSLAHELNQPLTAVLSNAQAALRFLAQSPPDLAGAHESLLAVVESDKRAGEVIRRLRSMLRKESVEFEALEVNEVLVEVIALMRSDLLNRGMGVELDLGADLPMVHGDRVQLQQVVLNLVFNACDAMAPDASGRIVTLRTRRTDTDIEVCVSDSGAGVPNGDYEAIFRPFVTSKADGMGLGLAVCRSLIESHKGRLWASANTPRGTRVQFVLPGQGTVSAAGESAVGPTQPPSPEMLNCIA